MKNAYFQTVDWLDWFTGQKKGREFLRQPFYFSGYRIATDTKILAAVPAPGIDNTKGISARLTKIIMQLLARPKNCQTISAKKLTKWAGPCNHTPAFEQNNPAMRPDYTPKCGIQLDKNLLAYVLEHAPSTETLFIWPVRTTLCLQSGTSWNAAIAGCVHGD